MQRDFVQEWIYFSIVKIGRKKNSSDIIKTGLVLSQTTSDTFKR